MNVFELFGTIAIDNTKADRALNHTSKNAKSTAKEIKQAFSNIGKATIKVGKVVVAGGAAAAGAMVAAVEGTRDYRTEMAKLDAAFVASGHSSEAAYKTYQELQAVLGETDRSVEAANHLAKLCQNEKDLKTWTDICAGVFATFGDSLPIEGLTEAANETAKVGTVTGVLADALNWAGIPQDEFNLKLAACSTEQRRQQLIMDTLNRVYKTASDQYKENAEDIMKANRAQESLNKAMAALGAIGEPILTEIKQRVADMVLTAVPHIETFIKKFREVENVWSEAIWPLVQDVVRVTFGVDVPEWSVVEKTVMDWWQEKKTLFNEKFKAVFGVDMPTSWNDVVDDIADGWDIVQARISGFFKEQFGVDMPTSWNDVVDDITDGWDIVQARISGFFKEQFGVDVPDTADGVVAEIRNFWNNSVLPNITDAFNVMVGLDPSDTDSAGTAWGLRLKTWFDGITASRMDQFNLTVGLLMHDTDETGKRWSEAIADWFHAMAKESAEQLKITFQLVTPDPGQTEEMKQSVTQWLHGADGKSGMVGLIANAVALPFEVAFHECVNVWEDFQAWLDNVNNQKTLNPETYQESEWNLGAKYNYRLWDHSAEEWQAFNKWIQATNEFRKVEEAGDFDADFESLQKNIDAARKAIEDAFGAGAFDALFTDYQSWVRGQVDGANAYYFKEIPVSLIEGAASDLQADLDGMNLTASVNVVPNYSGVTSMFGRQSFGGRTGNVAMSHAKGLDFVPRDGYLARLHYGEAVLNRSTADMLRSGGMGGDTGRLEAAIGQLAGLMQQMVANTSGGQQIVLDSGVLVGQIAPQMDARLGTMSSRKGRRN